MTSDLTRVVITGGGTGGHIFPGLALAASIRELRPGADIRFIGASDRLEARLVPEAGWSFTGIPARGLRGMGPLRTLSNCLVLPASLLSAAWHLIRSWPLLVVGMGGYVAGPVVAAAWLLRRKVAIHEQNLTPGWTNRLLGRLADLVMVSFPETGASFPGSRLAITGNPVREAAVGTAADHPVDRLFKILVVGGSQGAASLNRMLMAAAALVDRLDLQVVHQTGPADQVAVQEAYGRLGLAAEVTPFIKEIGRYYRWADLVICRAGATTMAELAMNGCAAVLVPFPGAAEGHQEANAAYLERRGAAVVVPDRGAEGGGALAEVIGRLRRAREEREALARNIRVLARPAAAREMASACLELVAR